MEDDEDDRPARSRAVFAPTDMKLISTALKFYVTNGPARPADQQAAANLIHRLGRI